jgi:hypothetical protein
MPGSAISRASPSGNRPMPRWLPSAWAWSRSLRPVRSPSARSIRPSRHPTGFQRLTWDDRDKAPNSRRRMLWPRRRNWETSSRQGYFHRLGGDTKPDRRTEDLYAMRVSSGHWGLKLQHFRTLSCNFDAAATVPVSPAGTWRPSPSRSERRALPPACGPACRTPDGRVVVPLGSSLTYRSRTCRHPSCSRR